MKEIPQLYSNAKTITTTYNFPVLECRYKTLKLLSYSAGSFKGYIYWRDMYNNVLYADTFSATDEYIHATTKTPYFNIQIVPLDPTLIYYSQAFGE